MNFPHHERLIPFLEHLAGCSREEFEAVAIDYSRRSVLGTPDYLQTNAAIAIATKDVDYKTVVFIACAVTYAYTTAFFAAKEAGITNTQALKAIADCAEEEARRLSYREYLSQDLFDKCGQWPVDGYHAPVWNIEPLETQEFIPTGFLNAFKGDD